MDMDPIISSALDIYADESVTKNELGEILIIHSSNDNIKQILYNLFYDILNIEFNMWSWTRNLVKYGDFYLKMYISPEYGVYMVEPISAYNVTRVENSDLTNKNYVKFQINLPEGGRLEELENYQVAHFRMLSDSNFIPYGKSIIEGGRRVWKQLSLMEDAMLMFGQPGTEIIYPEPGFPIYESMINYSGAKAVPMYLSEKNNFSFKAEEVLKLINDKTRLIIINNPQNPTGGLIEREQIDKLVVGLKKFPDVAILSDEIYSRQIYDNKKMPSF